MGPDLEGSLFYTFSIEAKVNGLWTPILTTFETQSKKETRTVDVPKGTYRVHCDGKYGRTAATSRTVKVKR
jgi:hypothetical protein